MKSKKDKKLCELGVNCGSTCIGKTKNCLKEKGNGEISVAATKLKGDQKNWPKGVKAVAFGRMKIFTSGHEKLAKKADLIVVSKADKSHIDELSKLYPDKKFVSADKGIFNYLAQFKTPAMEVVLGSDNAELGTQILKYKLADKIIYIDRPENSVSSSEARLLFKAGRSPQQLMDLGIFTTLKQAEYGFERFKNGF